MNNLLAPSSGAHRSTSAHLRKQGVICGLLVHCGVDEAPVGITMTCMAGGKEPDRRQREDVLTRERPKTRRPPMFRVVLLNDDYTPMEFVVWILQGVFHKSPEEATRLMLDVHNKGKGICGVFTHDVASTKAATVMQLAEQNQHPLQAVLEACSE